MVHALAVLPLRLTWRRDGSCPRAGYRITVQRMPAAPVLALAAAVGGAAWGQDVRITRHQCDCRPQTAAVPADDTDGWAEALRGSPFGPEAVTSGHGHLGAWVTAGGLLGGRRGRAARSEAQNGTWRKPIQGMLPGALALGARPGGLGLKAWQWNAGCCSMTLYPARICPIMATDARQLRQAMAFRARGWARCWLLPALALWSVQGAPLCLVAVATAAGAAAAHAQDDWAGGAARAAQERDLDAVRQLATRAAEGGLDGLQPDGRRVLLWLSNSGPLRRRPGAAFYRLALHHHYGLPLGQLAATCAGRKRWLAADGSAFRLVAHGRSFTGASRVIRVLAGGHTRGGLGPRTTPPTAAATDAASPRCTRSG